MAIRKVKKNNIVEAEIIEEETPSAKKKTSKISRQEVAADIISALNADKDFVGEIGFLENVGANVKYYLDTGSIIWNFVLSGRFDRGAPFGRIIEVFGKESTGKSLLGAQLIKRTRDRENLVIVVDPERALSFEFANRLGIQKEEIIAMRGVRTIEDFDNNFGKIVQKFQALKKQNGFDEPITMVLDSLAMLSSAQELKEPEKNDMTKARRLRKFFRTYMEDCETINALFFVVNQIYSKIGVFYGNPEETTGGGGLKYAASIRLSLYSPKVMNADGKLGQDLGSDPDATVVRMKAIKNRITKPNRSCYIMSSYDTGVDRYFGLFEFLTNGKLSGDDTEVSHIDILKKDGSWYSWPEVMVDEKGEDIKFYRKDFVNIFKKREVEYLKKLQEIIDTKKTKVVDTDLTEEEKLLVHGQDREDEGNDYSVDSLLSEIKK